MDVFRFQCDVIWRDMTWYGRLKMDLFACDTGHFFLPNAFGVPCYSEKAQATGFLRGETWWNRMGLAARSSPLSLHGWRMASPSRATWREGGEGTEWRPIARAIGMWPWHVAMGVWGWTEGFLVERSLASHRLRAQTETSLVLSPVPATSGPSRISQAILGYPSFRDWVAGSLWPDLSILGPLGPGEVVVATSWPSTRWPPFWKKVGTLTGLNRARRSCQHLLEKSPT